MHSLSVYGMTAAGGGDAQMTYHYSYMLCYTHDYNVMWLLLLLCLAFVPSRGAFQREKYTRLLPPATEKKYRKPKRQVPTHLSTPIFTSSVASLENIWKKMILIQNN